MNQFLHYCSTCRNAASCYMKSLDGLMYQYCLILWFLQLNFCFASSFPCSQTERGTGEGIQAQHPGGRSGWRESRCSVSFLPLLLVQKDDLWNSMASCDGGRSFTGVSLGPVGSLEKASVSPVLHFPSPAAIRLSTAASELNPICSSASFSIITTTDRKMSQVWGLIRRPAGFKAWNLNNVVAFQMEADVAPLTAHNSCDVKKR